MVSGGWDGIECPAEFLGDRKDYQKGCRAFESLCTPEVTGSNLLPTYVYQE